MSASPSPANVIAAFFNLNAEMFLASNNQQIDSDIACWKIYFTIQMLDQFFGGYAFSRLQTPKVTDRQFLSLNEIGFFAIKDLSAPYSRIRNEPNNPILWCMRNLIKKKYVI
jgi:hypothetical protein